MFNIGPAELIVILLVALLIVGPKRLPEVGKSVGKALREIRRQTDEVRSSFEMDLDDDDDGRLEPIQDVTGPVPDDEPPAPEDDLHLAADGEHPSAGDVHSTPEVEGAVDEGWDVAGSDADDDVTPTPVEATSARGRDRRRRKGLDVPAEGEDPGVPPGGDAPDAS